MWVGEGSGNFSFDLAEVGMEQARYIQLVWLSGVDVEVDAVMALHFNQPPRPNTNNELWRLPVLGGFIISAILLMRIIRKRKK